MTKQNLRLHRARTEVVYLTKQQMLENVVTHFFILGNGPAIDHQGTH